MSFLLATMADAMQCRRARGFFAIMMVWVMSAIDWWCSEIKPLPLLTSYRDDGAAVSCPVLLRRRGRSPRRHFP